MFSPVRSTAPSEAVVTLSEVKSHCRCEDFTDDDVLLTAYAQAAIDHLDGWAGVLGRCLVTQIWMLRMERWPAGRVLRLPFPDTSSISVKYYDLDNIEQTLPASAYAMQTDAQGSFIRLSDSFTAPLLYSDRLDPITVEQTCGYGEASDVPEAIKLAIKMMVAHWYENREAVLVGTNAEAFPLGVGMLLAPYRRTVV